LPSGVWGEWVRYPLAAVPGVPGGSGRGDAAGGGAGAVRVTTARRRSSADGGRLCGVDREFVRVGGGVAVRKKAAWSFRLRLHSSLRQRGVLPMPQKERHGEGTRLVSLSNQ
jgi:hypothetical protein